ncbi:mannose-1-phosphate guanylyltransferase [Haloquadratum walsbyi]|uniref:Mannose-1-phosphate guanylyltransferase n=1 Tax=Haloquadratum walsbyi J07HQW2 TaxID=1238425 RepID=U1MXV4_9EURY|nr:MAG: mannose-1-phosphate guanylyltransferase [Haloquadratum walsbyi J07HQW2]
MEATNDVDSTATNIVGVVLAGGIGSRLYPASRGHRPKQFLSLFGNRSFLTRTVDRLRGVTDSVFILTRDEFVEAVTEQVSDVTVITEPARRDTGPAALYATQHIRKTYDTDPVVLLAPSDHVVGAGFDTAMKRMSTVAAKTDRLVTLGITPTRPETGYGYIEPAESSNTVDNINGDAVSWQSVHSFHEKPKPEMAEQYIEAGHYWNAGIFAWRPTVFNAVVADSPLASLQVVLRDDTDKSVADAFAASDSQSVDRAIFEQSEATAVVPTEMIWDDIGTWDAFDRLATQDELTDGTVDTQAVSGHNKQSNTTTCEETVTVGDVEVQVIDGTDNIIAGNGGHISAVGVSGLIIVTWDDRTLVIDKDEAQSVRTLVSKLRENGVF